jgi:hypothetical protein
MYWEINLKIIKKYLQYIDVKKYIKLKQNDSCDKQSESTRISEAAYGLKEN